MQIVQAYQRIRCDILHPCDFIQFLSCRFRFATPCQKKGFGRYSLGNFLGGNGLTAQPPRLILPLTSQDSQSGNLNGRSRRPHGRLVGSGDGDWGYEILVSIPCHLQPYAMLSLIFPSTTFPTSRPPYAGEFFGAALPEPVLSLSKGFTSCFGLLVCTSSSQGHSASASSVTQ